MRTAEVVRLGRLVPHAAIGPARPPLAAQLVVPPGEDARLVSLAGQLERAASSSACHGSVR